MILNLSTLFKHRTQYWFISGLWFSVNTIASTPLTGLISQEIFVDDPVTASCTVLAPDIEYTYPPLQARIFQRHEQTTLPVLSQTWQVVCSAPVVYLFLTVEADQQLDSLSGLDPTHLGLGTVNEQGRLGCYQVTLDNATVDGAPVQLYQTHNPTHVGTPQSNLMLKSAVFQGWTSDGHAPAKGQQYSIRLTISPTLNSLQETQGPLVNGGELNGELVLAFPFNI